MTENRRKRFVRTLQPFAKERKKESKPVCCVDLKNNRCERGKQKKPSELSQAISVSCIQKTNRKRKNQKKQEVEECTLTLTTTRGKHSRVRRAECPMLQWRCVGTVRLEGNGQRAVTRFDESPPTHLWYPHTHTHTKHTNTDHLPTLQPQC